MSRKRYPIRIPRYAAGIRSQESRVGSGRSWWAKRWLERLEGMGLGGRLGRGKNYALSGQVLSMAVADNVVEAEVQGTRQDPYRVTLDFRAPTGAARQQIVSAIRREPMLVARLLTDDLPMEIEEIFRGQGFELFPGGRIEGAGKGERRYDMVCDCSCPDYANPCKHVTAALLILGEEIAWRPSTLLALRGIAMEELFDED